MDKEILLYETFATQIPERPKTPTMSPEEQRERYGASVADVRAKQRDGESFADAARRLAAERTQSELREALKPKEQPSQEALWHASNERDRKVKAHLKHWGLPISKYVEEAQKLAARGEL